MNIIIEKLNKTDVSKFLELIHVFEDVFEMQNFKPPHQNHLRTVLYKENFMVFTASHNGKVIGGLTAYILDQYYSTKPLVYIFDLAIKKEFQRKGIGKKLISEINEYCRNQDFQEVFVQADKVDDYALEFYRSTPISDEEQVVHFYYSLN